MTLQEIADALVSANREGRIDEFLANHYAPDCVSAEAYSMDPAMDRVVTGIDAIKAKHAWWESMMDVKEAQASDPMIHGDDQFAVVFSMKATDRQSGEFHDMQEVAVYTVKDGKIVQEAFFYGR